MTVFSIIVPAHGVARYLGECLDSVLLQSHGDFELIAIDDDSPDSCGRIIDEYARVDGRVIPVHLAPNRGLGGARNAGIETARGDYLVFLDGDDTLPTDTLADLADHLRAYGNPDVAMFDFLTRRPCGIDNLSNLRHWLPRPPDQPFRIRDNPLALRVAWAAWNKTYRRDFIGRLGLRFPPGYYEDAPWTVWTLLIADSISILDRVCVLYRCCRRGSITRTPNAEHAGVFAQFDSIFAFLDGHPEVEFPQLRHEIARRLTLVVQHLGADGSLVPDELLPAFRRRCERYFAIHRPAGYRGPDLQWPPSPWDAVATNGRFAQQVWAFEDESPELIGTSVPHG